MSEFYNDQWRLPNEENKSKQSNYSLSFDGSSQYIDTSLNILNNASQITISFWLNTSNLSQNAHFLGNRVSNNGLSSQFFTDGNTYIYLNSQSFSFNSSTYFSNNTWHNFVIVFDGSLTATNRLKAYVDNTLITFGSVSSTNLLSSASDLFIGYSLSGGYFSGQIDAVSIFNYALSSSQITTLNGSSSTGIGNPMAISGGGKPVFYAPLGDQDSFNGASYLTPNASLKDFVFDFIPNDYIDCGNAIGNLIGDNYIGGFTISFWMNPDVTSGEDGIFSFPQDFTNGISLVLRSNTIRLYNNGQKASISYTNPNNEWSNCVLSFLPSGSVFYLNGVSVANWTYTDLDLNGLDFYIGWYVATNYAYDGKLSNFKIWNTNLSSTEAATLYNNGSPIQTLSDIPQNSNLKAWYKLDASEIFNNTSTEWSVDNNQNPSAYSSSLYFDGNDYIDVSSNTGLNFGTGDFTYSLWVNTNDNGNNYFFGNSTDASGNNGTIAFGIHSANDPSWRIWVSGETIDGTLSVSDSWKHCIIKRTSGVINVFVNGVKDTSTGTLARGITNVGNIRIGAFGALEYINGNMSNFQIFNTALPETGSNSVETLYNNGSPLSSMSGFTSLISWYKLNNTTTGIEDSKGSNNGTNYGTTKYPGFVNVLAGDSSGMTQANLVQSDLSFTSGYSPYALAFDGADDYIDFNSIDLGTTNTISFWHKRGNTTSNQYVLGSTDGTQKYIVYFTSTYIYIRPDGSTQFITAYLGNTPYPFPPYKNTTDWANYIITRSGDNIKLYLNGVPFALSGSGSGMAATTVNRIGTTGNSVSNTINGKLSNIQFFNTALPATGSNSVETLYNNGSPLASMTGFTSLQNWWKLDNTTTGIEDSKGSNNGTNYGTTEYPGFVNVLAGDSSGMSQTNLIQSDLQTVAPYSKYAMNFDGAGDYIDLNQAITTPNEYSVSVWINSNNLASSNYGYLTNENNSGGIALYEGSGGANNGKFYYYNGVSSYVLSTTAITVGNWFNVVFVVNKTANEIKFYLNGNLDKTTTVAAPFLPNITRIGEYYNHYINAKLSNLSIWNTGLTLAQVTEIYNQGLPSNLNSYSAYSNLVLWWQLGENSSFDGNDWIVADEKGTNNGDSTGMGVGALVNGVGTTANGVSSSMSEGNLVGDAPYSTTNTLSTNMVVTSRVTGSGNTP